MHRHLDPNQPLTASWLSAAVAAALTVFTLPLRASDAANATPGPAAAAATSADATATTAPPKAGYESGLANILKISTDLHVALPQKQQQLVQGQPVFLEGMTTPCITPVEVSSGADPQRTVQISAGFIQLVNAVAHARALSEPGHDFVKTYAARLASAPGEALPPVTEGVAPEKAWDFDTMNVQAGQFNQLAGALIAIDLAHHYLGHYKKYAAQLATTAPGQPAPAINNFVTEKEWREAVLKGAKNALDCGLGVDGLKTLLECMTDMPNRPSWSAYFVPAKANLAKISKDLQRLENDFFLVEK